MMYSSFSLGSLPGIMAATLRVSSWRTFAGMCPCTCMPSSIGRKSARSLAFSRSSTFLPASPKNFSPASRNVAAMIPGSDPKLKDEYIIYSAHWDHLGIGMPVGGDAIYNGAIDNATGCAVLLELARAWGALPRKPKRSVLFLSVTAEEGGLKGSEYYAAHPLVPVAKTAVDLNFDALYP